MNSVAKVLIKIALYLVDHPDTLKLIIDAVEHAKAPASSQSAA